MSAARKSFQKELRELHQATRAAVHVERTRCSDMAEGYAKGALDHDMVVHAEVARTIAAGIRGEAGVTA